MAAFVEFWQNNRMDKVILNLDQVIAIETRQNGTVVKCPGVDYRLPDADSMNAVINAIQGYFVPKQ
jgi:hypothetical protein